MEKMLYMTPADIFKEYREAKDPKEQIKILADENVCTAKEIKDVLTSFGVKIKNCKKKALGVKGNTEGNSPKRT